MSEKHVQPYFCIHKRQSPEMVTNKIRDSDKYIYTYPCDIYILFFPLIQAFTFPLTPLFHLGGISEEHFQQQSKN
jgi:hypothetical protein